jgi:hypothetical protein
VNGFDKLSILREELEWVEDAVLIGLAAFGELERLHDVVAGKDERKQDFDSDLRPLHVDAENDTVSKFATALTLLRMYRKEPATPSSVQQS